MINEPVIMDGRRTADKVMSIIRQRMHDNGIIPCLGAILVGDDPASMAYVRGKHRDCDKAGFRSISIMLPSTATTVDVINAVKNLNSNPDCDGILVQLPLPVGIDESSVLNAIDPGKDADGLTPFSVGRLALDVNGNSHDHIIPCTPRGIMVLLDDYGFSLDGLNVCVLGRGVTIGRMMPILAGTRAVNATVDSCHTGTRNLVDHTKRADVIITGMGVPHALTPDMIKPGAILVDVGVSRDGQGRLTGDVHPDCHQLSRAYSPNPGGVGPMTRAMLLMNVLDLAERHHLVNA